MNFKVGDEIITVKGLWWHGEDIGDRLGKVVDTKGHILVEVYGYQNNPVKCFQYEVRKPTYEDQKDYIEIDIDDIFDSLM